MDIFSNPDTYNFYITNTTDHYFGVAGRLIPPSSMVLGTDREQPVRLDRLGIDYCQFKREYVTYPELRELFDIGDLTVIPLASPGQGVVCEWENFVPTPTVVNVNCGGGGSGGSGGIWQGSGPPTGTEPLWIRPTDGGLFTRVGARWLSNALYEYNSGRGFASTNNASLYSIDSTPTSSTPFFIAKDETIVKIKMESGNALGWAAKIRIFDTLTDLHTETMGVGLNGKEEEVAVDLNAGDKIEVYVESSAGIIYPRVKLITRERVV